MQICPEFLGIKTALIRDTSQKYQGSAVWMRPLDRVELILRTPFPESELESPLHGIGTSWTRLDTIHSLHTPVGEIRNLRNAFGVSAMFLTQGSQYMDSLYRTREEFSAEKLWKAVFAHIVQEKTVGKTLEIAELIPDDQKFIDSMLKGPIWIWDTRQSKMVQLSHDNYLYFRNQEDYTHRPPELPRLDTQQTLLQ